MKFENILNAAMRKDSFCITKEMVITGSVKSSSPGQIAGIVNGDVIVRSRLIILKEGIINGDIAAEDILVYGKINGDVKSCNKITVQSGAFIKGNITTSEIHIEKDAIIKGIITKSDGQVILPKKPFSAVKNEPEEKKTEPALISKTGDSDRQAWF